MRIAAFALSLLVFLSHCAQAQDDKARTALINRMVDPNGTEKVTISPDGKHLAKLESNGYNSDLVLIDLDAAEARKIVRGGTRIDLEEGEVAKMEPYDVIWVTNEIMAVDYGWTVESIDLKGKKIAVLGQGLLGKAQPDQPDSTGVLVFTDVDDGDVALVDAKTGGKTKYRLPMWGKPIHWAFDKQGALRAVSVRNSPFWKDSTTISNWYKPLGGDWVKLEQFKITDDYWVPMFVPDQPDTLIVASSQGRDTSAVFLYDTGKQELGKMLAGHPDQDILVVQGTRPDAFERVVTGGMLPQQHWFDPEWTRVQASIDATLPGRLNKLSGNPKGKVLVYSYGDVDPGRWYIMNVAAMSMFPVAEASPLVKPEQQRPMEILSYPAADGLTIPAYLTKPAVQGKPLPTVVLIHGGPTVRDTWDWNAEVQILAANGYAVFQPQFRGSSGLGKKFEQAGYRQWGLAMQDDITAGVAYLVKQGIADPNRICIYGASYGGYAALWGVTKTPDLYRCGISVAGVSDIDYMLHDSSDSNDDKATREIMRFQIGDSEHDQQQFDEVSPLKHADRIKVPLLIMHGTKDKRVPISHSKKMIAALKDNHKTFEWHELEEEGHGLSYVKDQVFVYQTILQFFDRNIGPGELPPAPPVAAAPAAPTVEAAAQPAPAATK